MEFDGDTIRKLRYKAGWMQKDLAEELNVAPTTISHWERGRHDPSRWSKQKLNDVFSEYIEDDD